MPENRNSAQREKEIFYQVVDIRDPDERIRRLRLLCGDDAGLLRRVERLLELDEDGTAFMDEARWDVTAASGGSGNRFPETGPARGYEVRDEIARGGMGSIREAEDLKLGRTVAIKVMNDASAGDEALRARFLFEAKVLAKLAHPNIVPVHDLVWEDGRPLFYSMKRVNGRSLQQILSDLREGKADAIEEFPLNRLLLVFRKVCDAMAFAHSRGILHRDLKPENIMVGEFGEVLVMDWGLAKQIGSGETVVAAGTTEPVPGELGLTLQGSVMGTPQYMSPEQARGEIDRLDERSDIFSLGGILYAMLTLRPPVEGTTVPEVIEKVTRGEIRAPSEMGRNSTSRRGETEGIALRHCEGGKIPPALSAVVMKAVSINPEDRYQRVQDLEGDVEAYLNGYATGAEQAGAMRQLGLFIRRHRGVAAAGGVAALLLLVLGIGGPLAAIRQASLTEEARLARTAADDRAEELRARLYASGMVTATGEAADPGGIPQVDHWVPGPGEKDLRGWEWYFASSVLRAEVWRFATHRERPAFFWREDSRTLVLLEGEESLVFLDAEEGRVTNRLPAKPGGWKMRGLIDGERASYFRYDDWIVVVSLETGRELAAYRAPEGDHCGFSLSPDGETLAVATETPVRHKSDVALWPVGGRWEDAEKLRTAGRPNRGLAWSFDGRFLAAAAAPFGDVGIFSAETGERIRNRSITGRIGGVDLLSWSPDSRYLAATTQHGVVKLVFPETLQPPAEWKDRKPGGRVQALAWSPDGKHFASAGDDRRIRVWEVPGGEPVLVLRGHRQPVEHLSWSPDGRWIASGAKGGEIRIWNAERDGRPLDFDSVSAVNIVEWNPGDDTVLVSFDGKFGYKSWILDRASGEWREYPGMWTKMASWDPRGERILYTTLDGGNDRIGVAASEPGAVIWESPGVSFGVAWSSDGNSVVRTLHGKVGSHDAGNGESITEIPHAGRGKLPLRPSRYLAWRPDAAVLAEGTESGLIQLHSTETGERLDTLEGHSAWTFGLDWNRDGTLLASASGDQTARIWDPDKGEVIHELIGHGAAVMDIRWSPDEKRVATASLDGTVRIWDPETGYEVARLPCPGEMRSVDWSPDGRQLIGGGENGLRLWDARAAYRTENANECE